MFRIRKISTITMIGLMMGLSSQAFANDSGKANVKMNRNDTFYLQQLNESSEMLGQVTMARKALDLGFNKDAVYHIRQAQDFAIELKSKSPELAVASTLRFNNKVYTFNNKYKDYLIPAVDDLFTLNDYDVKINHKKPEVVEDDLGIGRFQVKLDVRNVQSALNEAISLAQKGNIEKARIALNNIYKGAIEDSVVYEDPMWTVNDNLMASSQLIKEKDYNGARFALDKASFAVKTIEKNNKYTTDTSALKKLDQEITDLNESLRKKDPTILERAEDKISVWLKEVRDLTAKHAAKKHVAKE
ncbi:MAG: YfdX family protein [Bdellovibrionaceae bacterium]|nr:YfdX family protein [Pseudobdellovibrionaceae bacterium]